MAMHIRGALRALDEWYRSCMGHEFRRTFASWFTIVTMCIAALLLVGLMVAQAYIRWKINLNFSFLGGNVLEALLLFILGQSIALLYFTRE